MPTASQSDYQAEHEIRTSIYCLFQDCRMWSIIHASMQSLPNVRIKRKERYTIIAEACLQSQAPAISNPKYVLLQPLYDFLIHTFPKTQQAGIPGDHLHRHGMPAENQSSHFQSLETGRYNLWELRSETPYPNGSAPSVPYSYALTFLQDGLLSSV